MSAALAVELVLVPGGTFTMGNDTGRPDEQPAHTVTLAPFRAAVRPVLYSEYAAFVAATDAHLSMNASEPRFDDPDLPAIGINWFEAVAYCEWLARGTGIRFRLPTEAEREFAALGGLTGSDWPWTGDRHPAADAIDAYNAPHRPGPECANGYGLRCMAENVHEWCSDWYDPRYYTESPSLAPTGPASGKRRASRGGSWRHSIKVTRINARSSLDPSFHYADFGFRVYANAD